MRTIVGALFILSFVNAQWEAVTPSPAAFTNGGSVALGSDKIFVCGSQDYALYDAGADTWTVLASCPVQKDYANVVRLGAANSALVFTGFPVVDHAHEFNLDSGLWTTRSPYPTVLHASAVATDYEFVYSFGGRAGGSGASGVSVSYIYKPLLDAWAALTPMPTARGDVGGGYADGKAFVLGGLSTGLPFEVYTIATDTWATKTSPPQDHTRIDTPGLPCIGNEIFAVGSADPAALTSVHHYSVDTDTWTSLDPSPMSTKYQPAFITSFGNLLVGAASSSDFYKIPTGFTQPSYTSCSDTPAYCGDNTQCTDQPSPPSSNPLCECLAGAENTAGDVATGGNCTDIQECDATPAPCGANTVCTEDPTLGNPAICTCVDGYEVVPGDDLSAGGDCREIDECTNGSPCSADATCTDEAPPSTGHSCVCNAGFSGDGVTCFPYIDCGATPAYCGALTQCLEQTSPPATYPLCQCVTGAEDLSGNVTTGADCTDIQECDATPAPCGDNTTCTEDPTLGNPAICACLAGYEVVLGDDLSAGGDCREIDECTNGSPCSADATCTDEAPPGTGHSCVCNAGFDGDGVLCSVPPATVTGDPDFTSFAGVVQHLDLATGVFNMLTTRHAAINALVDEVDGMPAEENMGLLVVAVVARTCEKIFKIDCALPETESRMKCDIKEKALEPPMVAMPGCQDFSYQVSSQNLTFATDGLQVTVWGSDLNFTTIAADHIKNFPSSRFLNLGVVPLVGTTVSSYGGILGDLTNLDQRHLYHNLNMQGYTIASGCLFDPVVPSSAGVFAEGSSVAALMGCA